MFNWLKKITHSVKDLDTSVDVYKEETNNQCMPVMAYLNQAKSLIDQSDYISAKKILNNALEITQKDPLIYKYIGICEEGSGNLNEAINMYKISAQMNPNDKNIWHKLGMAQVTLKQYIEAEQSFENASKMSPVNTDIQTGWGMALLKQKKYAPALEKFTNAIKFNRYNFSAMLLAAIVEVHLEKYDDAEKKLNFLISANPSEACFYEYANLCFLKENYELAINYAQKSLLYNEKMLPSYLLLGKIYSMQFDYENAMKFFTLASDKDLEGPILYLEEANSLVRLYRFEEAKEFYQKTLMEDVNNIDAQAGLALCYGYTKNYEKAHELLDFIKEDYDSTFELEGLLEFAYGHTNEAIDLFKKALEKNPKNLYVYLDLAKCYEKLGNNDMVKDSYEKITKFNENYYGAFLDYAKYLIKEKDYKNAQRKLRKANKLFNSNQEILNLLFYVSYVLVKENVCEYNVKEAISIANKIQNLEYTEELADLEEILKNIQ